MQAQYTTDVELCQAGFYPEGFEVDDRGRVTRPVDRDTLPLVDIGPNGKPRPWRARHRQGLMLSEIYEGLAMTLDRLDTGAEGETEYRNASGELVRQVTSHDSIRYEYPERTLYISGTDMPSGKLYVESQERPKSTPVARYLDKAQRLAHCAEVAEFRRLPDGTLRLHSSSFCRVRLCPMCQWRRSLKLGAQVRQVVGRANADHIADTGAPWRWLMVTYTVRNVEGPDLARAIDTIHKGLNNMAKCKRWQGAVRGWLRATEVTHNTDQHSKSYDTYHPHLHMLLCVPAGYMSGKGYITQREWASLWGHYVKADYTPVVDVRVIKPEGGGRLSDLPVGEQAAAMGKACAEVSKYAAKPADYIVPGDIDLSMSAVQVLDSMLDRRRMTAWGGILKDIAKSLQLDDIETGDLIHIDETASADPVADEVAEYVTYNWAVGVGDYTKIGSRKGATPEQERAAKRADRQAVKRQRTAQQQADYTADSWTVDAYLDVNSWDAGMRRKAADDLRHLPRRAIDERIADAIGPLPDEWAEWSANEDDNTT